MHEIVLTCPAHIQALADNLRDGDAAEIEAAGMTPRQAIWRSYRQAHWAHTGMIDGEVGAIFGVGGCPMGKIGKPWLLTAAPVERAKVAFVREGRREVAEMLAVFPELRGYVDGRYTRALRFLSVLGFSLSHEFPFGPFGVPFRVYSMRRV